MQSEPNVYYPKAILNRYNVNDRLKTNEHNILHKNDTFMGASLRKRQKLASALCFIRTSYHTDVSGFDVIYTTDQVGSGRVGSRVKSPDPVPSLVC